MNNVNVDVYKKYLYPPFVALKSKTEPINIEKKSL